MRRRRHRDCIDICSDLLSENSGDQAVWYLKCRALTQEQYLDDTEMEELGAAELLMDENATAEAPRPGTSLNQPLIKGRHDQSVRPMTSSGRPLTGFKRPGTGARPVGGQEVDLTTALGGAIPATSRPLTSMGREIRLATTGMASASCSGGAFIDSSKLDLRRYARQPALAMALADYLLYVERNPRRALDLAAEVSTLKEFKDWWWKATLGKSYYKLGMLREAERQLKSSLMDQDMVVTYLELVKVYTRLDLPSTALDVLMKARESHPRECRILIATARIYDLLRDAENASSLYKKVLSLDASNVEAIASLAANHFYGDQPEVALRYYRRLLQMGANSPEVWQNLGLCCFYAAQYDMSLKCLERALAMASDDIAADVWYNIGQVAVGIGDLELAYQAFKVAISVDSNHAESYCNLAALEVRNQNPQAARSNLKMAQTLAPYLFEPFYNGALLAYRNGDLQEALSLCRKGLEVYPEYGDLKQLLKILQDLLTIL
ncbi:unnamed protein product [Ascophyllum nodosum]